MKKIYFWILCPLLLLLLSCGKPKANKFEITASIKHLPPTQVSISQVGFNSSVVVDSNFSDGEGNFKLSGYYSEPAIYSLKLGAQQFLTLIIDGSKIRLSGDYDHLEHVKVTGSPATASLFNFNNQFDVLSKSLISLRAIQDSLNKEGAADSVIRPVQIKVADESNSIIQFMTKYADSTKSMPVAVYVASNLLNSDQDDYLQTFSKSLNSRFPDFKDNELIKDFKSAVANKVAQSTNDKGGPTVGSVAQNFISTTLDGKEVALKDFRGKYVLLDFWASWCPPCRVENPNVVTAYNTYKDRNFTVLSFSLDNNIDKWKQAVENDNLNWTQASDLKGWSSKVAALYGVDAIPMNFLIGPDGKVVARNLRGQALENALQKYLPK